MATTRSSLLEGLEEFSEEEQLKRLLEISKQDAGPDTSHDSVSPTNTFEEWASLPSDLRLQMVRDGDSSEPASLAGSRDGDQSYQEDEEYRKAIEVSKKEKFLTEEEKTYLAIQQSLTLTSRDTTQPVDVLPDVAPDMGHLESAIRSSLSQSFQDCPAFISPGTVSVPPPTGRTVSESNSRLSQDVDDLAPQFASALPTMTFEEQLEEAMRQSVQDTGALSFDDQIRIALEKSSRDSRELVPSPQSSAHLGAIPRTRPVQSRSNLRDIIVDGSNVSCLKKVS